jgi:hypothetical protein
MKEQVFYVIIYLIASMGFLSLIWIRQGMKNLTDGLIRTFFIHIFTIAGYAFAYALWAFCVNVGIIKMDIYLYRILDSVFIAILFVIITRMAVYAKKIGIAYGFKEEE